MKRGALLFFSLLIISNIMAQTDTDFIKKVVSKIESFKTIQHYSVQKWGNIGDVNDFKPLNGIATFEVNLTDTIIKTKYFLASDDITDIYDGNKIIRLDKKEQTFEEEKARYRDSDNNNITSKMLYTGSIMDVHNILSSAINNCDYKRLLIKDSVYNGKNVKNVSIIYTDTIIDDQEIFFQKEVIFDKSNYLPLSYTSTSISDYGTQIINCQLSNYKIDDSLDIEMFKSIKIPTEYKPYEDAPNTKLITLKINQPSPKLSLPVVQGGNTSIEQNNGTVTLLEFSGVHCGFCLIAVKDLIKIRNKYDDKTLHILSVYSDETLEKLVKYVDNYKINYPVLFNNGDAKQDNLSRFGVSGIPHFIIIGKDGKIKWNEVGYRTDLYEVLCTEIEKQID